MSTLDLQRSGIEVNSVNLYEETVKEAQSLHRRGLGYRGLLSTGPFGISYPDTAQGFPGYLEEYEKVRETVARVAVEGGLSDREALDATLTEERRLELHAYRLRVVRGRR